VFNIRNTALSARYVQCLSVTINAHVVLDTNDARHLLPTLPRPEPEVMGTEFAAADKGVPGLNGESRAFDLAQAVLPLGAQQPLPQEQDRVLLRQPLAGGQMLEELRGQLLVVLAEDVAEGHRKRPRHALHALREGAGVELPETGMAIQGVLDFVVRGVLLVAAQRALVERPQYPEGRRHDFGVVLAQVVHPVCGPTLVARIELQVNPRRNSLDDQGLERLLRQDAAVEPVLAVDQVPLVVEDDSLAGQFEVAGLHVAGIGLQYALLEGAMGRRADGF